MLKRIVVIFLAFVIASAAAGIAIAIVPGLDWQTFTGDTLRRREFWEHAFFGTVFTAIVVVLPLFLLVILAESFRLRSLLLYALGGAAVMLFGYIAPRLAERGAAAPEPLSVWQEAAIAAVAGVVFGFVYWLLAGRKAGAWRLRRA
jgi:hypothetical protein